MVELGDHIGRMTDHDQQQQGRMHERCTDIRGITLGIPDCQVNIEVISKVELIDSREYTIYQNQHIMFTIICRTSLNNGMPNTSSIIIRTALGNLYFNIYVISHQLKHGWITMIIKLKHDDSFSRYPGNMRDTLFVLLLIPSDLSS